MRLALVINLLIGFFLWGCNRKSDQVNGKNEPVPSDSIITEIENRIAQGPMDKSPEYMNRYFYPVYVEDDTIMVFDSIGIGQKCFLIDLTGQYIIKTRTSKHKIYWTELFEKKVTITESDDTTNFQLAFVGDTAKVEWIERKVIDDVKIKGDLLSGFNISDYGELFEIYGGPISVYADKIKENPVVEMINYKDEDLYLISYQLESYPDYIVNGPSFLISNTGKSIYPLTGPCSDSESNIFLLNERLYIHTGSNCCDCGIVVKQLYEYDGSKIQQIIEDGSWSS